MAKGAYLTSHVRQLIAETYLENPSWGPSKAHQEVLKKMKQTGLDIDFGPNFPSVSSISKELTKCKENDENRSSQSKGMDAKWDLGKSVQYGFPPEATSDLLELWRWCLAAGLQFTIRQAKWVCYIRNAQSALRIRDSRMPYYLGHLYFASEVYSNRERICELLGIDLDTVDLDAVAIMGALEHHTALKLGVLYTTQLRVKQDGLRDLNIRSAPGVPFVAGAADMVALDLDIDAILLESRSLGDEFDRLYAYWLRYISKDPSWQNISPDDRVKLAIRLLDEIKMLSMMDNAPFYWQPTETLRIVRLLAQIYE